MSHFKPHIVSSYLHCETISHKITTTIRRESDKKGDFHCSYKVVKKSTENHVKIPLKNNRKIFSSFSRIFLLLFTLFPPHSSRT